MLMRPLAEASLGVETSASALYALLRSARTRREFRMSEQEVESFPTGVAIKLKTYVYRLIDPRNGETFYVGKGKGNRVFSHIHERVEGDELDNKLKAN